MKSRKNSFFGLGSNKSELAMRVVVIAFLTIGIGIFQATLTLAADRLIIKDDGGTTTLTTTHNGMVAFGQTGADPLARITSFQSQPDRMDIGYGGTGGGNLEAYHKNFAGVNKRGSFAFVYGGGNFGKVLFTHYDGSTWRTRMQLTDQGFLEMYDTSGIRRAYTDGFSWIDSSSRDSKRDIKELASKDAHKALSELNPVTFFYKDGPQDEQVGFVAEEVPELVAIHGKKGLKALDIVAVLTKVTQDQQTMIEKLTERVNSLEKN